MVLEAPSGFLLVLHPVQRVYVNAGLGWGIVARNLLPLFDAVPVIHPEIVQMRAVRCGPNADAMNNHVVRRDFLTRNAIEVVVGALEQLGV
jgi:hypothetical protein